MFRIPDPPSPNDSIPEIADYFEWLAIVNGEASVTEVHRTLNQLDDNLDNEGIEDDDDQTAEVLDDVLAEIQVRQQHCNGGYPFSIERNGDVLKFLGSRSVKHLVYRFLLFCTRLNMKDQKVWAGIDGTQVFEFVAADVLRCYLGRDRSQSFVFGTGSGGSFEDKVNELCTMIGEGDGYKSRSSGPQSAKDRGLDVVAWVPFHDSHVGKIIVFAQCKTGTNWKTSMKANIVFDGIVTKNIFLAKPVRAFVIAESVNRRDWFDKTADASFLLDRCRVVDFVCRLDRSVRSNLATWLSAAQAETKK